MYENTCKNRLLRFPSVVSMDPAEVAHSGLLWRTVYSKQIELSSVKSRHFIFTKVDLHGTITITFVHTYEFSYENAYCSSVLAFRAHVNHEWVESFPPKTETFDILNQKSILQSAQNLLISFGFQLIFLGSGIRFALSVNTHYVWNSMSICH